MNIEQPLNADANFLTRCAVFYLCSSFPLKNLSPFRKCARCVSFHPLVLRYGRIDILIGTLLWFVLFLPSARISGSEMPDRILHVHFRHVCIHALQSFTSDHAHKGLRPCFSRRSLAHLFYLDLIRHCLRNVHRRHLALWYAKIRAPLTPQS